MEARERRSSAWEAARTSESADSLPLRARRAAILAEPGLGGVELCRSLATAADSWLVSLATAASDGEQRGLALLAVGGYGRGELCPYSDLDLVLVHDARRDVAAVADAIWYPVWDEGVKLDHSVRTPKEVIDQAGGDLRVALGLLDGRLVWGDEDLAQPLLDRAVAEWRNHLGARWMLTLEAQMAERHLANGEVAYLLEPELKESHGGLRDVNVWQAVEQYAPQLAEHVDMIGMARAARTLTEVRVELHRLAGRAQDRLLLQDQDQVASALGVADADVLMARVAEAGSAIAWASDDAWRRRQLWQGSPPKRRRTSWWSRRPSTATTPATDVATPPGHPVAETTIEPGVVLAAGEVALARDAPVPTDPVLTLRLAAAAAERDLPISRAALGRLADHAPDLPDPWPEAARGLLVRTLETGRAAISAAQALDHYGLLTRLIPEWAPVRNRPQRNAYHRFTVDRHLLETAANAAELTGKVDRPDLLVVGALLHDIGKGYPGDHTEVGIRIMGTVTRRMGFDEHDVGKLQDLVRFHLLLPDAATRRDLDDPATIRRVADAVGDRTTLGLLAALTEADSTATGPSAWGPWKAGLVRELVGRVDRYLADGQAPVPRGWVTEADRALIKEVRTTRHTVVRIDAPRVVVAAPDRAGLLAAVAGVLALHGMSVRSADITSEEGVALEAFFVESERWPDGDTIRRDIGEHMSRNLVLRDRLAAKSRSYRPRRPGSAHPVVPSVHIDNDASSNASVIEVQAPDELGLLHRVTRALADCALDVVSARVATVGSEVVDAFYVRDPLGRKIEDPAGMRSVRDAVSRAIGNVP